MVDKTVKYINNNNFGIDVFVYFGWHLSDNWGFSAYALT